MGRERACTATLAGRSIDGRALLETDEVVFRHDGKPLRLKFAALRTVEAKGGMLRLDDVVFALGDDAEKWAAAIRKPKGRIDKLGVKSGQKVAIVGIDDATFVDEVRALVPEIAETVKGSGFDLVFFGANAKTDLDRLATLKAKLAPAGALWIVRPKGVKEITEADVLTAAKAAGLVDVKVVRFSERHTAEKVVIPVTARKGSPR